MKIIHLIFILALILILGIGVFVFDEPDEPTEPMYSDSMTLVLAAPSIYNEYYQDYFDEIVVFQVNYATQVLNTGTDDIKILVDQETEEYYADKLPEDVLVQADMHDIWMRDFATINPEKPVQFVYTDASMSKAEARETQRAFTKFAKAQNLEFETTNLVLDGGNVVDNYNGRVIVTTRFLEDNEHLNYKEAKEVLKHLLHADEVALILADDEVLAHADGMVAWIDDDVLAINDYSATDPEFHDNLVTDLRASFPDVKIVTVPVAFDDGGVDSTKGIGSACGINLNLVATYKTLYVPVFGNEIEKEVLEIIQKNTTKNVVEVNANNICLFGGSVRCTTWQLSGDQDHSL